MITDHGQVANHFDLKGISGFSLKIQKDIREIHQRTKWMQDQDKWKTFFIIGNICKMNAWVHLEFSYLFMHL